MHDHARWFLSIGLKGEYTEETPQGSRIYRAPWIRALPPSYIHRIRLHKGDCWTVIVCFKVVRQWGYYHFGKWIPWNVYAKSPEGFRRKNC